MSLKCIGKWIDVDKKKIKKRSPQNQTERPIKTRLSVRYTSFTGASVLNIMCNFISIDDHCKCIFITIGCIYWRWLMHDMIALSWRIRKQQSSNQCTFFFLLLRFFFSLSCCCCCLHFAQKAITLLKQTA